MDLHDCDQTGIKVVCLRFFGVENLHWVGSSWDGEDGSFIEILRELDGIQRSRSHDQFHISSFLYSLEEKNRIFPVKRFIPLTARTPEPQLDPRTFFNKPKSTSVWIVLS